MRIKFEKGMPPEAMADLFVKLIKENKVVIGSVNMYVEVLDNGGSGFGNNNDFYVCKPNKAMVKRYDEEMAKIKRSRIKVVV